MLVGTASLPVACLTVTSFPSCSHLQSWHCANMEGECLGDLVTCSHRQGVEADSNSSCFVLASPLSLVLQTMDGIDAELWTLWPPSTQMDITRKGFNILRQALPLVCLWHLSTWYHCTWPDLPDLPPPYLHTASDQRLEVGVAWEWG